MSRADTVSELCLKELDRVPFQAGQNIELYAELRINALIAIEIAALTDTLIAVGGIISNSIDHSP
jgi:hypothetical protein